MEQGWKDLDLTLHCPKLLREEVFSEHGDTACDRATGISKILVGTTHMVDLNFQFDSIFHETGGQVKVA